MKYTVTNTVKLPNIMDFFIYNGLTHVVEVGGGGGRYTRVPRKVPKVPITGTYRYL